MAKIFIVEDNEDHLNALELKLGMLGHLVVGRSYNSTDVIDEIKKTSPDLLLIDINLEGDNEGIALANQANQIFDVLIIFTTALAENDIVKKALFSNPEGYLLKPIGIHELRINIELALSKKEKSHSVIKDLDKNYRFLTVRVGNKLQKINYNQIILFERESTNYIKVQKINGKSYLIRTSLRSVLNDVLPSNFIQIHRQYIVNLEYIELVNEHEQMVHLLGECSLPIGRTFKKKLYKKLNLI